MRDAKLMDVGTPRAVIMALSAFVLAALPASVPAATPDIPAFTHRIDEISDFLAEGEMCKAAGYTMAPDVLEKTIAPAIDQAVKDGMRENTAREMMKTSLRAALDRQTVLIGDHRTKIKAAVSAGEDSAITAATKAFYSDVDKPCRGYLQSAKFGSLITPPEDDSGYLHFLDWLGDNIY